MISDKEHSNILAREHSISGLRATSRQYEICRYSHSILEQVLQHLKQAPAACAGQQDELGEKLEDTIDSLMHAQDDLEEAMDLMERRWMA